LIGHFNAGDLASYRAGIVSDGRAARISAHLSSCPECADVHSGLADVSQMLASIPAPPMPETLAQRLHAAISAEAAQRVATTSALGSADRDAAGDPSPNLIPGRPDLPRHAKRPVRRPRTRAWSSPLVLRGLAAAGTLVLLVGGGILLTNQRTVGTSSGIAEPASRPAKLRPNGPAAVGSVATTRLRYRHAGEFVSTNAVTEDVNYTKADLSAGVRHEVASATQLGSQSNAVPDSTPAPEPQHQLDHTTVGELESCLSAVAAGRVVRLVELARYLGQPATIIVFKPFHNAFDVVVVGEACGAASQDIITSLAVPTK
jgi:hypothetical protein